MCGRGGVGGGGTSPYISSQKEEGEKREEVRRLVVEHFNQGVSDPACPTLSSIIDACLSQADESLSHSSGLGILPPPWPMTLICINHTLLFFTPLHINTNTPTCSYTHTHGLRRFGLDCRVRGCFLFKDFPKTYISINRS